MNIIGRTNELKILEKLLKSKRPEFCALLGRRRIGKTFLIREYFKSKKIIFFNSTGMKDGKIKDQIEDFVEQIGKSFLNGITPKCETRWRSAFKLLTDTINTIPSTKKIVLFFDEFPWMATKNSNLLQILDYYWNQHWSRDSRIKLIICGSSASWIIDKIISNKGGLHNRITKTIHLEPLSLCDSQLYFKDHGLKLNNKQAIQAYIISGGVPYYLSQFEPGLSIDQNIDQLAFSKKSFFCLEFAKLFASLFDSHEEYIKILQALAEHREGVGQAALFKKLKVAKGYSILSKLKSLEECGFITSFIPIYHKEKGVFYKITDEYTLFYFTWIEPIKHILMNKGLGKNYWEKRKISPQWKSWSGYAFEAICHKHSYLIAKALGISDTAIPGTWRYSPQKGANDQGAQIDLLFDRDDDAITICEIKYTELPFLIDKEYSNKLEKKIETFRKITKTTKQLFLAIVSANGLKETRYSEESVSYIVTLNDLFKPMD